MSLKLHVVSKLPSEASGSYYCEKLVTTLRAVSYTDYAIVHDMPYNGPKSKVPWVTLPSGELLPDSYFILRHLISTGVIPNIDESLPPAARADARAWVAQVDELIYPTTLCERFLNDANNAELNAQLFSSIPWPLRSGIAWWVRRNARVNLWGHGVARHSDAEREMILSEFVGNALLKLEKESCLFGEQPCSADVALYAWCANCLQTKGNPFVRKLILGSDRLKEYVKALTERWFPEYEEILQLVG
ncbi:hypothetical protein CALVIDRAFT_542969 [Calocera viscosa TUFC12733]|uniref:Thioredoxin-like fold domain-containing protein n=1 Tax=Calocera viscosa (strain TUFC12733) TaxID=1330018 RepID=A0A167G3E2_CALVF|nr:hypothetical protein CALVIDRAFT_542969 [Calocera viscosa TUFC12733]